MPVSSPPTPYTVIVDSTGANAQLPNNIAAYILEPAGPVAAITLTLPATPYNGQVQEICTTQTITTLTIAAAQTLADAFAAALNAGQGLRYRYNLALATWFRII
jgi:hypothetical protein